jgi:hypothetical protein
MVREAIEGHISQAEWERLKNIEKAERASWGEVMERMGVG